jgi:oligopeptidase B
LPFESETYTAHASNVDFDTIFFYDMLINPWQHCLIIDFNMKPKKVKKEQEVLGGKFDKDNYIEERVWANAKDLAL